MLRHARIRYAQHSSREISEKIIYFFDLEANRGIRRGLFLRAFFFAQREGTFAKSDEKVTFLLAGERGVLFTDEKYQKSKRGKCSSFHLLLSPRGDSCEHTAPTVRP